MEFFRLAVQHKLNIIIFGGTGSGKTTFAKAVVDVYPRNKIFHIQITSGVYIK
ncbi:sigma 54-interacting transcriptional regulator [Salmonella enterica subsp. enterica serovar Virginia]|nr:sigma 54-interacting transcriptional regulator [Salmonella enterica subsp. enterica serovar Virginia]